jgi:hypothetical protein
MFVLGRKLEQITFAARPENGGLQQGKGHKKGLSSPKPGIDWKELESLKIT